jgi:hypothetical protein
MDMLRRALAAAIPLALAGVPTAPAVAGEATFGYLYTTDTEPRGKFEVEQWLTDREQQAHGYYHGLYGRTELEYGITDSLQASLYANYAHIGAHGNSVDRLTEGLDIAPDHDPRRRQSSWHSDGASLELLYRVTSPYTHPIGFAFYVEPQLGPRENSVEFRLIEQRNWLDDRLVLAANEWIEFDKEQGTNLGAIADESAPPSFRKTKATYLEGDLGLSYRFRPKWSFGLEFRNHNEYTGWTVTHDQNHTAFFFGPNVHYAGQRWQVTFAALRQLYAHGYSDDQKEQIYHGLLFGNEHTRWDGLRLIVARDF